jgi:hypothetical protein
MRELLPHLQHIFNCTGPNPGHCHQVRNVDRFVGAVGVFAARTKANGVDPQLAVETAVGRARPSDKVLRLLARYIADGLLDRLHDRRIGLGDIGFNVVLFRLG